MAEIKRLTSLDSAFIEQAAALERKALQTAFSAKQIEESLKTDSFGYFVALDGESVVGVASTTCVAGDAELVNLAVEEKKRRSGIATELLNFVFRELNAEGGENLSLEVASRNEGAVRFYENLGFKEVGRRRGFYRNPTDDALVMIKSL